MNNDARPYAYLIGWSKHNKWYYGIRYANMCTPADLWVTYFTSSKYVEDYRNINGEPDVIMIRRTFNDTTTARYWEHKVLKRLGVIHNDKWLNKTDNIAFDPIILSSCKIGKNNPMYGKTGSNHPRFGKKHTNDVLIKMKAKAKGENNAMYGRKHKLITCPYCGKTGAVNVMKRWHFEKCNQDISPKYIKKRVPFIFVNLYTNEYITDSMVNFSKITYVDYNTIKWYFSKGRIYKNWIRL